MQERHKHADRKHQGSIDEHAERQQQQQHAQERHNNLDLQHEARVRSLDGLVCGTEDELSGAALSGVGRLLRLGSEIGSRVCGARAEGARSGTSSSSAIHAERSWLHLLQGGALKVGVND